MPSPEKRSLTTRAFSGAFWTASGWGLSTLVQLVFGLAIARILGPQVLGIYAAALVVIRFSNLLGAIGIGPALVQRRELAERHIRTGLTMSVALSLVIGLVAWFGAPVLSDFFRMPDLTRAVRTLAFVFPIRGLCVVPRALLQRSLGFRRLAAIEASAYSLGFGIVGVTLALTGFGLDALIIATLSQAALELALLSVAQPHARRPQFDASAAGELLAYGGGITLSGLFGFLAFQGDKLVVGRLLGDAALGLYSRAYSLMSTSTKLYSKIAASATFPILSRVQMSSERSQRALRRGLALNALTVLPLSAILFVIAPELIAVLLGSAWSGMTTPFRILVLFLVFRGADKLCGPFIMSVAKVYRLAWIQAAFAALVVTGAWAGSHWGGIGGAAAGVAAAIVAHSLLLLRVSLSLAGSGWVLLVGAWGRPLALALLAGSVSSALGSYLRSQQSSDIILVLLVTFAVVLLLGVLLLAWPRLLLGDELLATFKHAPGFARAQRWMQRRQASEALEKPPNDPTTTRPSDLIE
ncbi:MAG: lipopolysaccharide biosynthesis protein [Acidobacteriota bacterium]|nr:lipopolysaccharide biosynthesis protein [Acidobacteriota bacterium]